jgi:hypothetical protein
MKTQYPSISELVHTQIVESQIAKIHYLYPSLTETSRDFPSICYTVKEQVVNLSVHSVSCTLNKHDSSMLSSTYGIDMNLKVNSVLEDEHNHMFIKQIKNLFCELGKTNTAKTWNGWQIFLNKHFNYTPKIKVSNDKLTNLIYRISNEIYLDTRKKPADFVIVSNIDNAILSDYPSYTFIEQSNKGINWHPYQSGRINNIRVFVDPYLKQGEMIIGTSTKSDEEGVYFVSNDAKELEEIQLDFENYTRRLSSRYAVVAIGEAYRSFRYVEFSSNNYTFMTFCFDKLKEKLKTFPVIARLLNYK